MSANTLPARCIFCGRTFETLWQLKDHECRRPGIWMTWAKLFDSFLGWLIIMLAVTGIYRILESLYLLLKK